MYSNIMEIKFPNKSDNERFARTVAAAFVLELDPTVDQISEIKTAVSEAVTNAKASLQAAKSSLEQTRQQLIIISGWNYNDSVEIGSLPDVDTSAVSSINVDSDIQTAIANNYSIKITERRLANSQSENNSQGIGEENNEVDAPLHDLRADLLVTAERTAVIALYRETGGFGDHSRGSSCAAQEMSL